MLSPEGPHRSPSQLDIKPCLGFLFSCAALPRPEFIRTPNAHSPAAKRLPILFPSSPKLGSLPTYLSRWLILRENRFQVPPNLRTCAFVVAAWNYLGQQISAPSISRTNGRRSTAYCGLRLPLVANSATWSAP